MRTALALLSLAALPVLAEDPKPLGKAAHVVIVVMDGLRPDSVTDADMPTLSALAKRGTFFANHHPVFLSSTEVNGSALATGMAPAHTGVTGNVEYRPDIDLLSPVDTQSDWASWTGDKLTGGHWLRVPTLVESERAAGRRAAVCGTKGVALLWDRSRKNRTPDQPTIAEGRSIPGAALDGIIPDLGPMPPAVHPKYFPNRAQDHWTTKVLTEKVWADDATHGGAPGSGIPALSVLWLSEPDFAQHGSGPGSKTAREALRSSDDALKKLLDTLAEKKALDTTDVMVVSDHGFSTIAGTADVADELTDKGFAAAGAFLKAPEPGTVVVVGLGGSTAMTVVGHDPAVIKKLVAYLQTTQWAGVIFTKDGLEGTFKHADAAIDAPDAPDVIVSMRWGEAKMADRLPGALIVEGARRAPGQGMHGSLSKYDMHNTLIAAGPDFRAGLKSERPSGNYDVTPTVLALLGVAPKQPLDGRVLTEAIDGYKEAEAPKVDTRVMTAEKKPDAPDGKPWKQYMKVSTVGPTRYYDEGNQGDGPAK